MPKFTNSVLSLAVLFNERNSSAGESARLANDSRTHAGIFRTLTER